MSEPTVIDPTTLTSDSVQRELESRRHELTGYCYRMLGSAADAEDAVQETFVRAWRGIDRFEGRAALRTWLYKIASNVCFDALAASQKRASPVDLGPSTTWDAPLHPPLPEATWITPIADAAVITPGSDPAATAQTRETVRLAFVVALQNLPPRQRAILILREVLGWQASEVADLLHLSVAAVNSALQRARATIASSDLEVATLDPTTIDEASEELLARYLDAFERYDMDALTEILHEDATQSMPPYPMWLAGRDQLLGWMFGPGAGCLGSRLVPVQVNGQAGFAQYRDGGKTPWSIQVPVWRGDRVADITYFIETDGSLFASFGLPPQLPEAELSH
ncbi:MAG: sigma-70 family RNA polymerase sigma factor [Solirubrobacteraceae bacterium]|nr:sigma-70 family RNA polymerase sigma factor [Patulibacter sp.]